MTPRVRFVPFAKDVGYLILAVTYVICIALSVCVLTAAVKSEHFPRHEPDPARILDDNMTQPPIPWQII